MQAQFVVWATFDVESCMSSVTYIMNIFILLISWYLLVCVSLVLAIVYLCYSCIYPVQSGYFSTRNVFSQEKFHESDTAYYTLCSDCEHESSDMDWTLVSFPDSIKIVREKQRTAENRIMTYLGGDMHPADVHRFNYTLGQRHADGWQLAAKLHGTTTSSLQHNNHPHM